MTDTHPDFSKNTDDSDIRIHSITNRSDLPFLSQDHPKHQIINPFDGHIPEPRLDGNVVDLSGKEE